MDVWEVLSTFMEWTTEAECWSREKVQDELWQNWT